LEYFLLNYVAVLLKLGRNKLVWLSFKSTLSLILYFIECKKYWMRPFKLNEDQTLRFHFLWNFISKFFMKEISKNFQILFLFGINIILIWNLTWLCLIIWGWGRPLTVADLLGNKITTVKNLKYRSWSVWVQLVLKTDFSVLVELKHYKG
jgi:hypothetical protein